MSTTIAPAPPPVTAPLDPADFECRVGHAVDGWFQPTDVRAFRAVDAVQGGLETTGDVLEIGTFTGRSAILLGSLLRPGEELVVNDLWDDLPFDPAEWDCIDEPARRRAFEANYLRFHPHLPRIVAGSSTTSLDAAVGDATCRFVHVDGSHEHEIVAVDLATAQRTCRPGGVMVFDDHMNLHHPGVTAAVWGAVDRGELRPLALTPAKLYAIAPSTAFPLEPLERASRALGLDVSHRRCCGHDTLRLEQPPHRGSAWIPPALKPVLRAARRALNARRLIADGGGRVPGVTALVVTFDSAAVIDGCLDALAAHAPDVPVVVVDNGVGDGTRDQVARRAPAVRLVASNRNGGYGAGINLGARHAAGGDDLLVLNPDTRIRAGAVDALRAALATSSTGIAVPLLLHPDGTTAWSQRRTPTVLRALGEAVLGGERAGRVGALGEIVVDPVCYTAPRVVDWASGAAMLVARRCHDALGGWDESFFLYAEETDLCLRAADRGWWTRFTPAAVVEHIGGHGERTPLRELMLVNKVVLFRRRHGVVRSGGYRAALALQEALRAWRGPYQRAALRRLLGRPSRLRLPAALSP